jgi:deoxyribose-phosphate aldolase
VDIAPYIDHTLLKATATRGDIRALCREALEYGFRAVCVPPYYVGAASEFLAGSAVSVATVVGFPFGYSAIRAKQEEIIRAVQDGAGELDMVICLAALKSADWDYLTEEITAVTAMPEIKDKVLKVIIESGVLDPGQIVRCCELYGSRPVQFLKTSTGYAEKGASVEAVRLMRAHLPEHIGIKASGGIRSLDFAAGLIAAGATRLGSSAGVRIVEQASNVEP